MNPSRLINKLKEATQAGLRALAEQISSADGQQASPRLIPIRVETRKDRNNVRANPRRRAE